MRKRGVRALAHLAHLASPPARKSDYTNAFGSVPQDAQALRMLITLRTLITSRPPGSRAPDPGPRLTALRDGTICRLKNVSRWWFGKRSGGRYATLRLGRVAVMCRAARASNGAVGVAGRCRIHLTEPRNATPPACAAT